MKYSGKRSRAPHWFIAAGILFSAVVTGGAGLFISTQSSNAVSHGERDLRNMAATLGQETELVFQTVDAVQSFIAERLLHEAAQTNLDPTFVASSYKIHDLIREQVAGFPQINLVTIVDAQGRMLNSCPSKTIQWGSRSAAP